MKATATLAPAGPQHMRALERANEVRLARQELKRRVAIGELQVAEVILECPWEAQSMAVADLLMSQRRWGQTRCRKFLAQVPMSEKKTIGSMTDRQRRTLASMLGPRKNARSNWIPRLALDASFAFAGTPAPTSPPVDNAPTAVGSVIAALREVGSKCDRLGDELKSFSRQRDELIAAASSAGASRRTVADAAHLTVGRVQQIVEQSQDPHPDESP